MKFGIINERITYKANPVVPKIINVADNRLKPSFSSILTNGLKINASRMEKINIRKMSERRNTDIKISAATNIQIDNRVISFMLFSVIYVLSVILIKISFFQRKLKYR
jgi:hypothetical protein